MKKTAIVCLVGWSAAALTVAAAVSCAAVAWARYKKVQKIKSCSRDAMQMIGNMLLSVAKNPQER